MAKIPSERVQLLRTLTSIQCHLMQCRNRLADVMGEITIGADADIEYLQDWELDCTLDTLDRIEENIERLRKAVHRARQTTERIIATGNWRRSG